MTVSKLEILRITDPETQEVIRAVQVREARPDGGYHRRVITPESDLTGEAQDIQDACAAAFQTTDLNALRAARLAAVAQLRTELLQAEKQQRDDLIAARDAAQAELDANTAQAAELQAQIDQARAELAALVTRKLELQTEITMLETPAAPEGGA